MLFVTNDTRYLQPPRNNEVRYAQFSIEQYKEIENGITLDWNGALSISANRPPISINHTYSLKWNDLKLKRHKYLLL